MQRREMDQNEKKQGTARRKSAMQSIDRQPGSRTEQIKSRIAETKLTAKDRLVLDYILKNQEKACFMTSAELAGILGISASSVVRVSAKLGFNSFTNFKRILQEELAEERCKDRKQIPYERIKNYTDMSEEELIAAIKENALRNIEKDQTTADYNNYRKAADLIGKAPRVFIAGFRACSGFSLSFGVMLGCVRSGVYVVEGSRPLVDTLVDLTPEDAVIVMSYERYSSETVFAAKMAREAGSHIVALTDKYTSPLCASAEAVILSTTDGLSFYNSYTAIVMAMEVLTGLVSKMNKKQNEDRLMKMEEYLRETGQY